jgi:putative nucleotidyltransferase with HDIG domain
MSGSLEKLWAPLTRHPTRASMLLGAVLVVGLASTFLSPQAGPESSLIVGAPSPEDFESPRGVSYESRVLTEQERERAAAAVPPQFTPMDRAVAGVQTQRAQDVLAHIGLIRADPYATELDKVTSAGQVPELSSLSAIQLEDLIGLEAEVWEQVTREIPIVVAQTLRQPVRPDALSVARASVVANVDRAMDPSTAQLVAQVASLFVVPNTAIDEARTEAAREAAREAQTPVVRTLSPGEAVVRAGDILTEEDMEALEQLGLISRAIGWRDTLGALLAAAALVTVCVAVINRLRTDLWRRPRSVALIVLLILIFSMGASAVLPGHTVLAFAYPMAAVAMTCTVLWGLEMGIVVAMLMAVVAGYLAGPSLEMAAYTIVGSLAGAVVLSRVERLATFLVAGMSVGLALLVVLVAFRVPDQTLDVRGFAELAAAAIANGVLSTGLTTLAIMAVGSLFGVTTSLQLLELARPDHPLLREMQTKAPGTYAHSLVLANLAERAATTIGADALLVRVGSYYHDVGKSIRPYFFIENQVTGFNPHDRLDPLTSAEIISEHVPAGAELARSHRLPDAIVDFIWQHHGTTRMEYFYRRAVDEFGSENVEEAKYRYPGPKPARPSLCWPTELRPPCEPPSRNRRKKSRRSFRRSSSDDSTRGSCRTAT